MQTKVALQKIDLVFCFAQFRLSGFCLLNKNSEPCWVNISTGEIQEHL